VLAGTDLHFSGGGVEISSWQTDGATVSGTLDTGWDRPVNISVAVPAGDGFEIRTVTVEAGEKDFSLDI
jgi:hypothetical protein